MKRSFVCLTLLLVIKLGFTQTSFTDLVTKTEKSVVMVSTYNDKDTPLKVGTAFFIVDSGILLSNFHVFEGANSAKITTSENKQYQVEKILSSNKEYDLIRFSISNSLNEHFPILDMASNPPAKGEDIFVIGTPEGFGSSVSKGIVSGIRVIEGMGNIFQITAPISSGSSGSPVLNMQGKVFAIASYQYQTGQNLNFAIDLILVDKLKSNEAFNSAISINKELPNDITEAKKIIDRLDYQCSPNDINLVNDFILKFPNDYYGYFKRARIFSCISLPYNYGIKANSEQKRIEFLISADKDFTKALLLSANKNIVYWYRGTAKYVNVFHGGYTNPQLIGWDQKGAISDFNKATGLDSKVVHAFDKSRFEYIGDLKKELNDFTGALSSYKQAITSYPESSKIYVVFGNCASIYYFNLKDLNHALIYINKAIAIADLAKSYTIGGFYEWDLFELRAYIKYDLNDLSGSLADLNTLFDECDCIEAISAYNHYLKALIISQINGDMNEVIASLNKAIQYVKDDKLRASIYNQRSLAYLHVQNYQLALIDLNKYFELAPISQQTASDYYFRSRIKSGLNDDIGALKDINKAIEIDCKDADLYYCKGSILSDLNDKFAAIRAYDKAIELNPKDPVFYSSRGVAKYGNDNTGACSDWSKAGELGDYKAYDLIKEYCK